MVNCDISDNGISLTARSSSLLKHQEHPPAVVINVNEGGCVNVKHDPGLESFVIFSEPGRGLLTLVYLVLFGVVRDRVD